MPPSPPLGAAYGPENSEHFGPIMGRGEGVVGGAKLHTLATVHSSEGYAIPFHDVKVVVQRGRTFLI